MTEASTYSTPQDAILRAVDDAGGAKRVGTTLRPEWDDAPATAAKWVHHCAGDSNRSKFGLGQIVWIFRTACRLGHHTGFQAFARLCGYDAKPIDVLDQVRIAQAKAAHALVKAQETMAELDALTPELLARAHAVHLKVED